jgi:hypothetical protein
MVEIEVMTFCVLRLTEHKSRGVIIEKESEIRIYAPLLCHVQSNMSYIPLKLCVSCFSKIPFLHLF